MESNPHGTKLLTRLHLGLSQLFNHKFGNCFQDTLNPLCDCGNNTKTTTGFFCHCPSFHTPRQILTKPKKEAIANPTLKLASILPAFKVS